MVIGSAIVAALLGWMVTGFEEYGFVLGGMVGAILGWLARRTIRVEIERATAGLQLQVDVLAARLADQPPAVAPVAPPQPAHVVVPPVRIAPEVYTPAPPPPPPAPDPVIPRAPGVVETALAAARAWLLGGNTIVRLGLVILFVGLSFLASYAASAGLFPIEWRLAIVAAVGVALLVVGFRTRHHRPGFGLALQGGGVGIVYLTLFAAARLYDTVAFAPALALMVVVCALGCALALLQRSQALAATAFAGGFAAPLLLSDGGGAVAGLFGYYTILNLAILFIAWRRSWRLLDLLGMVATFGILTLWMARGYQPADFAVTQAFLIASVLIYVACAILYTRATPGRLGNVVDTTLLFGPALAGFGLEAALVHDRAFGSAFAALGFAALYLGVAAFVARYRRGEMRVMHETMLAIGIGFVTLAIPLALGARWTSAAWALEGAGAFWVGKRQARWMPRLFGLLLQAVAALIYLEALRTPVGALPLAHPGFVGAMLIALAAAATAWWLRTPLPHIGSRLATGYANVEAALARPAFLFAFAFWWLAWVVEAQRILSGETLPAAYAEGTRALSAMLAYVASAWGAQAIGRRLDWRVAGVPAYATLVALVLGFVGEAASPSHVLYFPDWAIWAAAIAIHLRVLYRIDREDDASAAMPIVRAAHVGGVWLGCALVADCLLLGLDRGVLPTRGSWAEATLLAAIVAVLAALTAWAGRALRSRPATRWPLAHHAVDYAWYAAAPVAALLVLAMLLVALLSSGSADPLPYLPLLNPTDLSVALAIAVVEAWRRTLADAALPERGARSLGTRGARGAVAALAFVAVNTAWLRVAHHLLGIGWSADALLASFVVQTGLAILWTLLALALMVVAHRRGRRTLWLIGAALLGVTVVKLLLIDMNNAGGGERIVAFLAVGVLMLVVGYLAPLPPRAATTEGEAA